MLDRILLILKTKNLSSSKLADKIGVQRSSVSHVLSGRNKPSLDFVMKILNNFPEISYEWMLSGTGEMYRNKNIREKDLFSEMQENAEEEVSGLNNSMKKTHTYATQNQDKKNEIDQKTQIAELDDLNDHNLKRNEGINEYVDSSKMIKENISSLRKRDKVEIEKIIVLYNDKSFITYSPSERNI